MNTMTYKGQTASVDFDERDDIFVGQLLGITDVVGFHADTVRGLRATFTEAVDDYVETCAKAGKAVEKPASGKLMLRILPEVHSAALIAAKGSGTSLNPWAAKVLGEAARV